MSPAKAAPRLRARERGFSMRALNVYHRRCLRVRVPGWLFLDYGHASTVERERATLWEIHPVSRIDVWRKYH